MIAYFCQPSAPWQKGSFENSNGRIRRFLPSATYIAQVPRAKLMQLADRLNRTPRKCLAYRTPDEVLAEPVALVLEAGA
jgi:transposase, IS30 family